MAFAIKSFYKQINIINSTDTNTILIDSENSIISNTDDLTFKIPASKIIQFTDSTDTPIFQVDDTGTLTTNTIVANNISPTDNYVIKLPLTKMFTITDNADNIMATIDEFGEATFTTTTIEEQASVSAPASGFIKIWAKNDTYNTISRTNDTDTFNLIAINNATTLYQNDYLYYDLATTQWKRQQAGLFPLENTTQNFLGLTTRPTNMNTTTALYNTLIGDGSMSAITTGDNNIGIGLNALNLVQGGSNNIALGSGSLSKMNNASNSNIAIGADTLQGNLSGTGSSNVAIGHNAGINTTAAACGECVLLGSEAGTRCVSQTIAIGRLANWRCQGLRTMAIGYKSLYGGVGYAPDDCISIGYESQLVNNTGTKNISIGNYALDACASGTDNIALGYNSLTNLTTGTYNIALTTTTTTLTTGNNNIIMGQNAMLNSAIDSSTNICIGESSGKGNYTTIGNNNVCVGNGTAWNTQVIGASNMTLLGADAGNRAKTQATHVGSLSGQYAQGARCVSLGYGSLRGTISTTGNDDCVAIGYNSQVANLSGTKNTSIGNYALDACTTGTDNVAIGHNALTALTIGTCNFGISGSLQGLTEGHRNIAIGNSAGNSITTGSDNIIMGWEAGLVFPTTTTSNLALMYHCARGLSGTQSRNQFIGEKIQYVSNTQAITDCIEHGYKAFYNSTGTETAITSVGNNNGELYTTGTKSNVDLFGFKCGYDLTGGTNTDNLSNVSAFGNNIKIGTRILNSLILGNTSQKTYIDNATGASSSDGALQIVGGAKMASLYVSGTIMAQSISLDDDGYIEYTTRIKATASTSATIDLGWIKTLAGGGVAEDDLTIEITILVRNDGATNNYIRQRYYMTGGYTSTMIPDALKKAIADIGAEPYPEDITFDALVNSRKLTLTITNNATAHNMTASIITKTTASSGDSKIYDMTIPRPTEP